MKKFVYLLFAVVLMFSLAACGNSEEAGSSGSNENNGSDSGSNGEKKELADKLNLFNWTEYMPQEVIKGFEEEYGVDVVYSTYTSNQEMFTKLKSGTVSYDIVVPSTYYVTRMVEQGMLAELNMENIPNFKNIGDTFKDRWHDPGNKYSIPYMYGTIGITYNEKKVKEAPDSWSDLWNPEYKGHVIISEVAREAISVALQKTGNSVNKITEEALTQAKEALAELHPKILAYDSTPTAQFVSEEAWIGESYSGDAVRANRKNPNITYVLPEEGGLFWMDNMVIPKNSKHKYTAEVFINYILRPEVSKKISEAFPYSNPNVEAKKLLSEEMQNNPAIFPPQEKLKNTVELKQIPADKLQRMNQIFQKVRVK